MSGGFQLAVSSGCHFHVRKEGDKGTLEAWEAEISLNTLAGFVQRNSESELSTVRQVAAFQKKGIMCILN